MFSEIDSFSRPPARSGFSVPLIRMIGRESRKPLLTAFGIVLVRPHSFLAAAFVFHHFQQFFRSYVFAVFTVFARSRLARWRIRGLWHGSVWRNFKFVDQYSHHLPPSKSRHTG